LVGSTVDNRYLVHANVARGGMSTVYLATDLRLNRHVALKVLHAHLATDNDFLDRLQREARTAASLSNQHVVGIYDQGRDGSLAYLVMEYIAGHTARDVLNDRGALSPRDALDLMDPVVAGLAAAHAAGLIHRDVKPENVLISADGRVKIGDFGLSRAVTTTTNTATLLGTVAYIAPELVTGQSGDARSDIYSAGIMLYELLTGVQPFRGEIPIHVAMQHVSDEVPPPSRELPGLSPDVDELVRYMTEREPDNRPADGSALLEDLRHIRRTLSAADLDYGPSRARIPGATDVILRTDDHQATTVLGGAQTTVLGGLGGLSGATDVIGAPAHHTSVLPAHRLYVGGDADTSFEPDADTGPLLSKREAREQRKAAAKAAARPTKTLQSGHPRRRAAVWLVLVVLLAVLGAGAGWFFGMGPGALAKIPSVHNKTVAQAEDLLRTAGFSASTKDVFNEVVAQGLVVSSDPVPGTQQRRFQGVTLLVSKGPVLYQVPVVTGRTLTDAKAALTGAKLAAGAVTETYNEKTPAGVVLSQAPAAGTEHRGGTKIDLVVSKGPKPIPVPNVVGEGREKAAADVTALGLVPVIAPEEVNSATIPAGSVAIQSPDSGNLTAGGKVTLTISKGPKMVRVPDMVGKQVGAAKAELEALGFKVNVENLLGGFFGTVRFQDPQGTEAPEGSTVTLKVI
jgi:eukaryotic-like serine/threonine-protein kinase